VRFTARVPATSANLGPGFDCFGLALELTNETTADTEGTLGIKWEGEGEAELPSDGTDMISRAMAFVAHEAERDLPPLGLHSINRIPLERGLGSSSAAVVAGVMLASRILSLNLDEDPAALFQLASRIERHPDNVAAAVYGGFTMALSDGPVLPLRPHPDLRPVALIPVAIRLSTLEARKALTTLVPRPDAVYNVSHAALMVVALTERPDLLDQALRDRLHQDARLALVPEVREVFERIAGSGVPVCVSGAGPTLLAFGHDDRPVPDPGEGWRVLPLAVRLTGAEILVP
jgi:homoserine kinase